MKYIIMLPYLSKHDAVSLDAQKQRDFLQSMGHKALLYAELYDNDVAELAKDFDRAKEALQDKKNILIYHHCVYWAQGEELLRQSPAKFILRYHSITPEKYFVSYDRASFIACLEGRKQTLRIIQKKNLSQLMCTSSYTQKEIEEWNIQKKPSFVVAPAHDLESHIHSKACVETSKQLQSSKKLKILFVGRIVPHKNIEGILDSIERYMQRFGTNCEAHISGSFCLEDQSYYRQLSKKVNTLGISSFVHFHSRTSLSKLIALYKHCDIFMTLSHHEGFGVPILEAQYHKLPVCSWNVAAIKETCGPKQLVFDENSPEIFAQTMHRLQHDSELKKYLIEQGKQNYQRFEQEKIQQNFALCLEGKTHV